MFVAGVGAGGTLVCSADAGSVVNAPMSSSTTATFAYGSFGVELAFGCGGTIEWESDTTGTTCRFAVVVFAGDGDEDAVAGASAGSGASRRTCGTRNIGALKLGTESAGNCATDATRVEG